MAEVAAGGGCLTVDVRNSAALAAAIARLGTDRTLREQLTSAAASRPLSTWADYRDAITRLLYQ